MGVQKNDQILKLVRITTKTATQINGLVKIISDTARTVRRHDAAFVILKKGCQLLRSGNNGNGNGNGNGACKIKEIQTAEQLRQEASFIMKFWHSLPDTIQTIFIVAFGMAVWETLKQFFVIVKNLVLKIGV
jgi:hypothetical protein